MSAPRIVGFVCNWDAYSGIEMAGVNREEYPASVRFLRVPCLGRVHTGLVLKAFEMGAGGVMLLRCPADDCHYDSGPDLAKEMFSQAGKMLDLLGIGAERLALVEVPLGRSDILAREVSDFVERVGRVGTGVSI